MKAKAVFFSIPCENIERAAKFYNKVFGWELNIFDCPEQNEKMAMIDCEGVEGCLFWNEKYKPSINGSQISFEVESIDLTLEKAFDNGAKILMQKCKIDCDTKGFCALIQDSEGNAIGLYSAK